jgi:hypothetical protein
MNQTYTRILITIFSAGVLVLLFVAIGATSMTSLAAPNADALVSVAPVMLTTTITAVSVPVDIHIENVNGLYGADVQLTFDPALLAVQDADPGQAGIQIELGPLLTSDNYFAVINTADNVSGTVRLAITQLNPALPVTGSGVLAGVTFTPVGATGVSPVHLTQVQLASQTGESIPATTQDGTINIQLGTPAELVYLPFF